MEGGPVSPAHDTPNQALWSVVRRNKKSTPYSVALVRSTSATCTCNSICWLLNAPRTTTLNEVETLFSSQTTKVVNPTFFPLTRISRGPATTTSATSELAMDTVLMVVGTRWVID